MTKAVTCGLAIPIVILLALQGASGQANDPDGASLFARYCASCHGSLGEGDGPVASAMAVTVPNLRTLSTRSDGTFPREAVMQYVDGRNTPAAHGERLMPVWGETFALGAENDESSDALARRRIAAITDFVGQLQN
jgi:mono/diheme cytochrome c family protein